MPEHDLPSIGFMLDQLGFSARAALTIEREAGDPAVRDLATTVANIAQRVEDVVVVLRDHLSCHDCDDEEKETM
jgi:hypothetical protein